MVELAAGMVNHFSRSAKSDYSYMNVHQGSKSPNFRVAPKGWALRVRKSCAVFSENLRAYLTSKFDVGVKTGRKLDPKTVAKQMRNQFPNDEWLT